VVFVDCGYCELLICFDYVGKNLLIVCDECVFVCLEEIDGVDEVLIV